MGPLKSNFKQSFKMYKGKNYKLAAGDSVDIVVSRNKSWNYSDINSTAISGNDNIQSLTEFVTLRLLGSIAHSAADFTKVGISPARLDYTVVKVINWNASPAQRAYKHFLVDDNQGVLDAFADEEVAAPGSPGMMELDGDS